jgi:hypothetical protein
MSAPFATKLGCPRHIRFTPVSDRTADIAGGPVRAISGHSVTLSARAKRELEVTRLLRPKKKPPKGGFFPE